MRPLKVGDHVRFTELHGMNIVERFGVIYYVSDNGRDVAVRAIPEEHEVYGFRMTQIRRVIPTFAGWVVCVAP